MKIQQIRDEFNELKTNPHFYQESEVLQAWIDLSLERIKEDNDNLIYGVKGFDDKRVEEIILDFYYSGHLTEEISSEQEQELAIAAEVPIKRIEPIRHGLITVRQLKELINSIPESALDNNLSVFGGMHDEFYSVERAYIMQEGESDIIDGNNLILVSNNA